MMKPLDKRFNFKDVEDKFISEWQKNNIFKFRDDKKKDNFCIMMPPPNVTGSLHMGHALTFTLQDILVRFHKKLGLNVLWQPGTDHAGIATEIVVEKKILKQQKLKKKEIGREEFLKKIWEWKEISGDKIVEQLKKLGTSVDWSMSRFTLDEGLSKAVNEVFIELFNKGLIYRDKRLINWDPILETAVSDLEVKQKDQKGKLWYIKYKVPFLNDYIVVATTRPETMFGDSCIAVHPKNKKLKKYIGLEAVIPFTDKSIPILADEYADPKKGSGAVKITPAHDFNDFEIGKKHNLEFVNIFNKNAKLNDSVPKEFCRLDRYLARKKIIDLLTKKGLLKKVEENNMVIPIGDRSGSVIEPLLTEQWFVNSKKLCESVKKLIKEKKINFFPSSWMNTFKYWIENIEPWCISRQIWWGHRIPIWYTEDNQPIPATSKKDAEEIIKKKKIKSKITHQDPDVLDTWFSSALWPFSTLGWPQKNDILKRYYPTNVLVTGFDIIFFWVARMIMMGLYFMKSIPFENIYIHPLVRDEKGEKMSKSKGNVIDPLELINQYGADALRFTLANLSTQGRDIKLSGKLVENSRNFITKLWNVARFAQFNKLSLSSNFTVNDNKLIVNTWILSRFNDTQKKVLKNLKDFKFNLVVMNLYHFVWNDFCDLYIEFCKFYLKEKKNFKEISNNFTFIFKRILNLMNPIIPFVSEKISKDLKYVNKSIYEELIDFSGLEQIKTEANDIKGFNSIIELIKKIRLEIDDKKKDNLKLNIFSEERVKWLENNKFLINSFFNFKEIKYVKLEKELGENVFVVSGIKFEVVFNLISEKNFKDVEKKKEFYKKEIKFFESKLNNQTFIKKAPKKIINEHRQKLEDAKKNLKIIS